MTQLAEPYSRLRKNRRLDLAAESPLAGPMAIYVEPTNVCNFRCTYCPESFADYKERSGGYSRMDLAAFTSIADQILVLGKLKVLHFYMMGEPFLNRSLPEFLSLAAAKGVAERTCVTTNGTVLDSSTIARVLDSGLDYLRVSVYGATDETATRRTGVPTKVSRVVSNVAALKAARQTRSSSKPFIYIKMIDTGSEAENQLFLETFQPVGDEVAIEPVMNWNDPKEGNLAQRSRGELLSSDYFRHAKRACPFPFYTLVIHSDLRVSVCCVDWAKEAVVGDLREESLTDIWRGTRLRDFRLAHLRGDRGQLTACAACTYLYTAPDNVDALSPETYLSRCSSTKGF